MITLFGFGPAWGLPDPSPFVGKADILLKMSGVPYQFEKLKNFKAAPKGKMPYIVDGDTVLGDSTFIRFYLEQKYGIDFDPGMSETDKAMAWLAEKHCEDHLYFILVDERWMIDANFVAGPRVFFERVPALIRPLICRMVRKDVKSMLQKQGMGRHSKAEQMQLARRSIDALAALLGERAYFGGQKPCGADAGIYSMLAGMRCRQFKSAVIDYVEARPNLVAYCERMQRMFYP